ncbi:MAG: metallophosphoesterase [Burkholderiales bacterium]
MKLNILSDLHLRQESLALPDNDADVVVLAGDVARPEEAVAWAARIGKPTLYVAGNHEFYGGSIPGTRARLRDLCAGTCVHFLDDAELVIGDVRFLGSTLWSDFRLAPTPAGRAAAMEEARAQIRDFSRIRRDDAAPTPFAPEDAAALFAAHAAWLEARLAAPHAGPTVVVTHHAPSPSSIHPRFAGSPLNACFVSDAERLLDGRRACLWVHGHTHDSFDYTVTGTRVVCNPRGYAKDGVNENPRFDPDFVVEVGGVTPRPAP